jgi:hypothetical protein
VFLQHDGQRDAAKSWIEVHAAADPSGRSGWSRVVVDQPGVLAWWH